MPVTVGVNFLSVVHKASNGFTPCFPDVCKTPTPGGPVPIPYPNFAFSSDTAQGTKKIKCDGNPICHKSSNFRMSTGDEPGTVGGVISSKVKGKAEFVNFSFDVKVEGQNACRAFDLMLHNDKNTPPFPVIQGPIIAIPSDDRPECLVCGKTL